MIKKPGAILALLTGLNLLNYADRVVVSAVLPKIQDEFGLSNFVGGLLATVCLLGYFATSPLFGVLGDRMARKGLIAFGVFVWSLATALSGIATGAMTLSAARAAVGIGEASYGTLAPTVIDDVTPALRKGRALSIFYFAMPIGAALGYLVGGLVEKHWGWRSAFFVAGGPGMLLAFVCLFIKEPTRPARTSSTERPNIQRDFAKLISTPLYRQGVLGYCAYTAAVGAFSYWAPTFLYAHFGLALSVANFRFGLITVIAGGTATLLGGALADRMKGRIVLAGGNDANANAAARINAGLLRICAMGSLIGAPLAVVCFLAPGPNVFFACMFFCIFALFVVHAPINAVVLGAVPPELRASAMALSIFSIHALGDLWSPPLVGLLADHLPLPVAMMTLPAAIAASAWLWWPRRVNPADPDKAEHPGKLESILSYFPPKRD
jgi:MFS family permease